MDHASFGPVTRLLVAALAVCAVAWAPVTAGAAEDLVAVSAKKKCKKGKKGKKAQAAKKGCKRKKKVVPVTTPAPVPVPTPVPPPPTLRATLTWNDAADLDLLAYAPDGTIGAVFDNVIPSTQFSADDTDGFGPETFTDLLYPSTRQFSYVICVAAAAPADGTVATLAIRRADGSTFTGVSPAGSLDDAGDGVALQVNPGGVDPMAGPNPC